MTIDVAPGTIRGTATATVIGGVEPPPGTPMIENPATAPCEIIATSKTGVATKTQSNAKGEFELTLAPGDYTLSFLACMQSCNATPVNPNQPATVKSGEITRAFFHCQGAAP